MTITTDPSSSSSTASLFSSLGIGSGLDLSSLLTSLSSADQAQLAPWQQQQTAEQTRLSAYGVLTNAVNNLKSASDKLSQASLYQSTQITASGDAISAAGNGTSAVGRYQIQVSQLAQAQSLVASPVADENAQIGQGGTISLSVGKNAPVKIDISAAQSNLAGIRDAINSSNAGVSASIINDGSNTPYRLVLTSNQSGTDNEVTVSAQDASGANGTPLANLLDYDSSSGKGSMTQTVAAQNAQLTVNGLAISRDSNSVNDAIPGVTLTLNSTTGSSPSTVSVSRDSSAITSAVQAFVTAYNQYQTTSGKLTAYNGSDPSSNGVLLGDSATRTVDSDLQAALQGSVAGSSGYSTLGDIGISLQPDGTLSLDSAKLNTAATQNPGAIAALLSGPASGANSSTSSSSTTGQGIAGQISSVIAAITGSNGVLTSATDGVNKQISETTSRISQMQTQINQEIDQYRTQFQQLDATMAQLNSTQSYLTTQLANLNGNSNGSSSK